MAKASTLFEILARDKVDVDEIAFHMNNDLSLVKSSQDIQRNNEAL